MTRKQRKRLRKLRRYMATSTRRKKLKVPRGYNRHHRRPRSRGGSDDEINVSVVDIKQHASWHNLFSNLDPHTIADIISQRWLDPEFRFVCVRVKET
jgi:hypothetical protein